MAIVLDLILLALFIFIVFCSYRRGFVRTVVELAGYVLVCVLAFVCTGPMSGWIFDTFMEEPVTRSAAAAIQSQVGDSAVEAAGSFWSQLPDFVTQGAAGFGITEEGLAAALQKGLDGSEGMAGAVTNYVARPILTGMTRVILIIVIFLVGMLLVRLLARTINRMFQLPVIGTVNRVLGGALGLVKATLLVLLLCWLVGAVAALAGGDFGMQLRDAVQRTWLFKWLYGFKPF